MSDTADRHSLKLFTIFHLNLMYSSLEEEQRRQVLDACYWPLLKLAKDCELPFGIEAPGITLEIAEAIDPLWVRSLRELCRAGVCEFVGSGYSQLIGPLVPTTVNRFNLFFGHQIYARLLGNTPTLALVNEQAYSAGLVEHYRAAGYQGIVMEWNNPVLNHPEWSPEWRFLPQYACGSDGESIPLLWNNSISFQKFQRFVHDELDLEEYLTYLRSHLGNQPRLFSLYGNDAEVIDFRPGRYRTEPEKHEAEWEKVRALMTQLQKDPDFQLVHPSRGLEMLELPGAGHRLHLETPAVPCPVKKQPKYNLSRWSLSGRDSLGINSACWRIAEHLDPERSPEEDWRELCYLWSSDFRTHITESRWKTYRERLKAFSQRLGITDPAGATPGQGKTSPPSDIGWTATEKSLTFENDHLKVRFNCRRGLAIESLWFKACAESPLVGTLPHGYYDDIRWGADYYTGHLVFERPGLPKITDLMSVKPHYGSTTSGAITEVACKVATPLGPIEKYWSIDIERPALRLTYQLTWPEPALGSLRLGHFTLTPTAFDPKSLYFKTHNGGSRPEIFYLTQEVDHGEAVNSFTYTSHTLGLTEGWIEVGDQQKALRIDVDRSLSACCGLVSYHRVRENYFCRFIFSAREIDDTSKEISNAPLTASFLITATSPTAIRYS